MLWLVQINLYTSFCALNTQGVHKIVLNILWDGFMGLQNKTRKKN